MSHKRIPLQIAATVFGVSLLYTLSEAPVTVYVLNQTHGEPKALFEAALKLHDYYRPVDWFIDNSPTLTNGAKWYMGVWQEIMPFEGRYPYGTFR